MSGSIPNALMVISRIGRISRDCKSDKFRAEFEGVRYLYEDFYQQAQSKGG